MLQENKIETDVLMMGAGLAGIMAAVSAAEAGADVCIVSSTNICSGSSFYPGTWGLGMIGPENREDEKELEETILRVGEQMADPELVRTFVSHIPEGIEYLKAMGLNLKQADAKGEKEFIPCFDHKSRNWNGLIQQDAGTVFLRRMEELGIHMLPDTEIIRLVKREGAVCGAVALSKGGEPIYLSAGSVVIASGGMGGIFEYRLNTGDITGMGQYLALEAGASLVNLEFFQMMPGYISPAPKTIYNEKVFCYSCFQKPDTGVSIFEGMEESTVQEALEIHSSHGPYTTRLKSRIVDETIFRTFLKDRRGVEVSYKKEIWEKQPEFVRTYFEWLWEKKGLTVRDSVRIGMFAHASNGGIMIDSNAWTGVPGLYACGEVTGGMHGADRLGGLSTANGMVFGRIAGKEAAAYSQKDGRSAKTRTTEVQMDFQIVSGAETYLKQIQAMNTVGAMIDRSGEGASKELEMLLRLEEQIKENSSQNRDKEKEFKKVGETSRLYAAVLLTKCLLSAILLRAESRGPHNRTDYPQMNPDMSRRIISTKEKGTIKTEFENRLCDGQGNKAD